MNDYCLLYNPRLLVSAVFPVLPLNTLLNRCNETLQQPQESWTPGQIDDLARLVRLNWMVEDLKTHPIIKPLVLNLRYFLMTTITGDTRLQAIELSPHVTVVSALLTIKRQYLDQFPDWTEIKDNDHLASQMRIPVEKLIFSEDNYDWKTQELDWIEFDLVETSHHMHDEDERFRMIVNYLEQHPDTVFTRKWLQNPIKWSEYA